MLGDCCRLLDNSFAVWTSPDNQHAVWQGHWLGMQSLVDRWTQGAGWVCLLFLCVAWFQGKQVRWGIFRLFLVFLAFSLVVSVFWSTVQSSPMNYTMGLNGSDAITGGRYLYPVLVAWLAAGAILLLRLPPAECADPDPKTRARDGRRFHKNGARMKPDQASPMEHG